MPTGDGDAAGTDTMTDKQTTVRIATPAEAAATLRRMGGLEKMIQTTIRQRSSVMPAEQINQMSYIVDQSAALISTIRAMQAAIGKIVNHWADYEARAVQIVEGKTIATPDFWAVNGAIAAAAALLGDGKEGKT